MHEWTNEDDEETKPRRNKGYPGKGKMPIEQQSTCQTINETKIRAAAETAQLQYLLRTYPARKQIDLTAVSLAPPQMMTQGMT